MAKKRVLNPVAATVGAAVVASTLSAVPAFASGDNPFATQDLAGGFMLAEKAEGACGEGKCGEGNCGGKGPSSDDESSDEGKAAQEGSCGEKKAESEGKCGEGKCGG